MLHFVLGTAGTGKTTFLREKIKEVVNQGKKVILIVPEQFSFESERALFKILGAKDSLSVEVLSFTRLCNSIFRAFGGLAGAELSKTARYLLMSVVVDELRDSLKVYRKSAMNISFLSTILAACSEFKAAGITASKLSDFSLSCEGLLAEKAGDLAALYEAYQSMLEKGYTDPEDSLIRAVAVLEENDFFSDYTVFVDGFTAFMAGEYSLLRHVIACSHDVWFALTTDTPHDNQQGMGLFSPVKATVNQLTRIAKTAGVPIENYHILEEPLRFKAEGLAHLSKNFLEPAVKKFDGDLSFAEIFAAGDIFDETEHVAASIATIVREEGCRYRDIAVVARDTCGYLRALELAFSRYGIPYFLDDPEDIENKILTGTVLSALDAVRGSFDSGHIIMLAKSPVLGFDMQKVAELENYVYIWNIRGALWLDDFANNPRGMAENLTDDDVKQLEIINEVRESVMKPLTILRDGVKSGTGRTFAKAVYEFLQAVNAAENIEKYAESMPQGEKEAFLDESARLWDILVDVLEVFGEVLGNIKLPAAKLCDLFRLAAGSAETAAPPQTLDQVIVGKADRIRPENVSRVFIIGANDGVFPPATEVQGIFSDEERRQMIDAGMGISMPSLYQVVLERFFAYFAVTLPSEKLYISYCKADIQGRVMQPSMIISQIHALFPGLAEKNRDESTLIYIQNKNTAFSALSKHYSKDTVLAASLREYFMQKDAKVLSRLEKAAVKPPHMLHAKDTAKELFGGNLRLSPSRVEKYYHCPFSYFAAYGLNLKKRQKVEFSPLESGSILHHILHVMVQKYGGKGLCECTQKQLENEIAEIIREYITSRIESMDALPVRFKYLFERLCGTAARLLKHMGEEFAQSKFDPAEFELPIRIGEKIEPISLVTANGTNVVVEGIVDRVDVMTTKTGKKYVRVVDYKSGRKEFKLQDIICGLNMQMLLYLFTIQENGRESLADSIPAGVLYMPANERFITTDRTAADSQVENEKRKSWRMSGLLLEDDEALRGMEENLSGVFIPVKMKKDGTPDSASSLASLDRMGKLSSKVKDLVAQMADSITGGNVAAVPVDSADYTVCRYCDYKTVCGFEEGDPIRKIAKLDREKVLRMLEEEYDS